MDTELARTFLEIVSTGSFIRAAERLHVAQTTVSARIRLLEERLGRPLFVRNKSGASLTPAGEQFLRYAPSFVQLWQRVRHQVAVPPGHRTVLAIGGDVNLWQSLLLDWMIWLRHSLPDIALRVHVDVPQDLIDQVADGLVDAAVMYAPPHRPGLKVDLLLEEKLVMVSTKPDTDPFNDTGFVAMDWGPAFAREYAASFPEAESSGLAVNLGPLALSYILSVGGYGYFRMSAVQSHVAAGQLYIVPEMPQYSYPIYAVRSVDADETVVGPALAGLHSILNRSVE